jgi:hypothetical protein
MPLKHWNATSAHDLFVDPSVIRPWSCRYLESHQVLGEPSCDLCGYHFGPGGDRKLHFDGHALRQCDQELYCGGARTVKKADLPNPWVLKVIYTAKIYFDPDLFFRHLVESHELGTEHNCRAYLWHHAISLFYELREGKAAVDWQQSFEGLS